jgi:putative PIN family toxin of toxin-antitoxin system
MNTTPKCHRCIHPVQFIDGDIQVVISEEILTELRNNVAKKFPLFLSNLPTLEALIKERAFAVQLGTRTIDICRDPDDNMILETAITGSVDFIITGNKDLLILRSYSGIKILTPTEFLSFIEG